MPDPNFVAKRRGPKRKYYTPRGRPANRPLVYNEDIHKRAVALIRAGWTKEAVAEMCNVSFQTFYTWQNQFPKFLEDIKKARTDFDEIGSNAAHFLLQKQTLKKRRITKTIENGKEVTKTELYEEEIAPNASVAIRHMARMPIYKHETATDAIGSFARAFAEHFGEKVLPDEPTVPEATSQSGGECIED